MKINNNDDDYENTASAVEPQIHSVKNLLDSLIIQINQDRKVIVGMCRQVFAQDTLSLINQSQPNLTTETASSCFYENIQEKSEINNALPLIAFKELGDYNLRFDPGTFIHPVAFEEEKTNLKKLVFQRI